MTKMSSFALGVLATTLLWLFIGLPLNGGVPRCAEDEVVTVKADMFTYLPDECVNREDANYEFGYWTGESDA